jgi:hypothetical protein
MRTNWQPIKFLIEIIALQILIIGFAVSLVVGLM